MDGPIDCPFGTEHGFKFSYDKGKGECEWPESELEPCTDTKRLMLNYQACPNVQGSELMSKYTFGKGRKISKTIVLGFNSSEKLSNNNEFDSI